uniref:Uncharacterized protein n=1 Tax=Anopheles atroparvus TaxID=41427 RepID=A0A182J3A9_ANOAO
MSRVGHPHRAARATSSGLPFIYKQGARGQGCRKSKLPAYMWSPMLDRLSALRQIWLISGLLWFISVFTFSSTSRDRTFAFSRDFRTAMLFRSRLRRYSSVPLSTDFGAVLRPTCGSILLCLVCGAGRQMGQRLVMQHGGRREVGEAVSVPVGDVAWGRSTSAAATTAPEGTSAVRDTVGSGASCSAPSAPRERLVAVDRAHKLGASTVRQQLPAVLVRVDGLLLDVGRVGRGAHRAVLVAGGATVGRAGVHRLRHVGQRSLVAVGAVRVLRESRLLQLERLGGRRLHQRVRHRAVRAAHRHHLGEDAERLRVAELVVDQQKPHGALMPICRQPSYRSAENSGVVAVASGGRKGTKPV